MPCCGLFSKKRAKSVPPGGTKINENKKKKKDVNQSQPNLSDQASAAHQHQRIQLDQAPQADAEHLRDIRSASSYKQIDDEVVPIYPVPVDFQGSEPDQKADELESLEDDDIRQKQSLARSQDNLDILNEQLQNELNAQLATRRQLDNESVGNATLRASQFVQDGGGDKTKTSEPSATRSTINTVRNLNQTNISSFKEFELSNANQMSLSSLQKLIETINVDKTQIDSLQEENRTLKSLIDDLKNDILAKETKYKQENDALMNTVHETLTKEASNEERESLVKLLASKKHHANETLIQEQARMIESLKLRCEQHERERQQSTAAAAAGTSSGKDLNEFKEEISVLRALVHRLNAELSAFQCKYPQDSPSLQASLKKFELNPLPSTGPVPIWLVNTKFLSPLIAAYDDRLIEKDEKLRLFKKKLNELTGRFEIILNENKELNIKLEKAYSIGRVNDPESFNEMNNIRTQAILVLEENKSMSEQLDLMKTRLIDAQKNSILEINNLSKKIIVLDTEKLDLRNQYENLRLVHDDLLRRFNDVTIEAQSRVRLQEHLNQTGELKRKIGELDVYHKHELEQTGSKISSLEGEKKDLMIKNASLTSENKRLLAENKVLDKALNEGIGRKTQRRIQQLEKRIEANEMREQTSNEIVKNLEKEIEKLNEDKQGLENLLKEAQIEMKKQENRLTEENLKVVKLETKLEDFKGKSAEKLASVNEKIKQKDAEFGLVRLEHDKRIADLLNLLHKKQNEIDELIKEKRQMEGELEMVWQSTLNENRNMQKTFLDLTYKADNKLFNSSHHYKLLLDD